MSELDQQQLKEFFETATLHRIDDKQSADKPDTHPYKLTEEAFNAINDVCSSLTLLGMLAADHNRGAGGIPADLLGDTLLMITGKLEHIKTEAKFKP